MCYISEIEVCRKLKFGEVTVQIRKFFLGKKNAQNFRPEGLFKWVELNILI